MKDYCEDCSQVEWLCTCEEENEQVNWTVLLSLAEQLVELSTTLKEEKDEQVRSNL